LATVLHIYNLDLAVLNFPGGYRHKDFGSGRELKLT
jgi:hypothetical protein